MSIHDEVSGLVTCGRVEVSSRGLGSQRVSQQDWGYICEN